MIEQLIFIANNLNAINQNLTHIRNAIQSKM